MRPTVDFLGKQAVLEQYLQTLINLPVKNNDEVIAFLTSDIIKETNKPISREGYKEGYLTKRGKNFGGWKTRFFVLQGPQLEYYESVRIASPCSLRPDIDEFFSVSVVAHTWVPSKSRALRLGDSNAQQTGRRRTKRTSIDMHS